MSARTRRGAALLLACLAPYGCAERAEVVRVERGPLLRSYAREVLSEGGVQVSVSAVWPKLTLTFAAFDLCHAQKVEEYAEERIVERTAAYGPALSLGITGVLGGAALLAAGPLFSPAPDRSQIDRAGRYGPSPRTVAGAWSLVLAGVGLPALGVGAGQAFWATEDRQLARAERVVSDIERRCNAREFDGQVVLRSAGFAVGPRRALALGAVSYSADELAFEVPDTVEINGRVAFLADADASTLASFFDCVRASQPVELERLSNAELSGWIAVAEKCKRLPQGPGAELGRAGGAELERRRSVEPTPGP